jgi:hypothetical protein
VQIVVYGLEGNAGLFMKLFRALRDLVQPGEEFYPSVSEKKQEGRGPMGIIEFLEAVCWRGFGQDYPRILPVYQSFIPEIGDYSRHRPAPQAKLGVDIQRTENAL